MATRDNLLVSAVHGTAWRLAEEQGDIAAAVTEIRRIAGGRNDILAQAARVTAGSWYARPAAHIGHELIVAGLLILAGDGLDYDELERWTRVGYVRATAT